MCYRIKFVYKDKTASEDCVVGDVMKFSKAMYDMGSCPDEGATGALWFRGHSDVKWNLTPAIARPVEMWGEHTRLTKDELLGEEHNFLHRFRRYAHTFYQRELSLWEAITLAQHHGLPTRLLDWTSNPLVALYFAAVPNESGDEARDGAIYYFRLRNDGKHINVYGDKIPEHFHEQDPFKVRGVKIIYPMNNTQRLVTQSGAFTIQNPRIPLEKQADKAFAKRDLDIFDLTKLKVLSCKKIEILQQLERMGINRRTLFPDLDGVAKGILHTEMLRIRPNHRELAP